MWKTYSVVLDKRHTVIVDTPNFKGPNLGHFFDENPSEIVHRFFWQSKENHSKKSPQNKKNKKAVVKPDHRW